VRAATSDEDVIEIHRMLVYSMAAGAARAPVDADESMLFVYNTAKAKQGAVAMMAFLNGKFVGTLGLLETRYWYSKETFLREVWLYVLPDYENSDVMRSLLMEARALGDLLNKSVIIAPTATGRQRGARREHIATIYQYSPAGEIYAFHPRES